MKRLFMILLISFAGAAYSHAQFNTIMNNQPAKRIDVVDDIIYDSLTLAQVADSIDTFAVPKQESLAVASLPLDHIRVTSRFGWRQHPVTGQRGWHNGVDLAARFEAVSSMMPGVVETIGRDDRSGLFVIVRTETYTVSYCHLAYVFVYKGSRVDAGQVIAQSGNTGRSTGPHLHITMRHEGRYMDPMRFLCLLQSGELIALGKK